MIKAYSYMRFSSYRQVQGDSVRRQTALAQAYATKHDLDLQDLSLADMAVSAFRGDNNANGALGEFIQLVRDGQIEKGSYLLVESFDRLSRQAVDVALQRFLELVNLGVVVVTLSDEQVFRSGELDLQKLVLSLVYMSRANEESEMKSRRTKAVWDNRREQARHSGEFIANSNYPRWLKREGDNLRLPPENKKIINLIFQLSIEGYGYQKIADKLNQEGYFTFHKGKPWVGGNIHSILRNKAVIGEYQPHVKVSEERVKQGEPIKNYYPEVVPPAVFLEAQEAINNRNKRGAGYRKGTFTNLFTGLIRCECGKSITLGSKNKSGGSYLKCSGGCHGQIRYQYIEPQILTALSMLKAVTDKYKKPTSNELANIQLDISEFENKLIEVSDLFGKFPSEAAAKSLQQTENKLGELKEIRESLIEEQAVSEIRGAIVLGNENLDTAKERGTFNSKLKAVLDHILLNEDRDRLIYYSEGQPVLEQRLYKGYMKLDTVIYEMDGTVLGRTCREKPLELIPDEKMEFPEFEACIDGDADEEGSFPINIVTLEEVDGAAIKVTRNYSVEEK